ncbi:MAG TPA: hypothetical protein VFE05_17530 [Longimicrobiaceae bacterium]|jgi:hypothetical protein|nr:hypothetical protein [Longimicrobiaceae bacterium]
MKHCRYCAEEIQDAAVICRFCNRSQVVAPPERESSGPAWVAGLIIAGGIAMSVFAYVNQTSGSRGKAGVTELLPPMAPPPALVSIVDTSAVEIRAGHAEYFDFKLSDPRTCTLEGRIVGLAGGRRDVDVMVLDDDGFTNWRNGSQGRAYFSETRTSAVSLHVVLPSPGSYHLVVSNRFSVFTRKAVQIRNAQVTCS